MYALSSEQVDKVGGGVINAFIHGAEEALIDLSTVGFGILGGAAGTAIEPGGGTAAGALLGGALGHGLATAAVDQVNSLAGISE